MHRKLTGLFIVVTVFTFGKLYTKFHSNQKFTLPTIISKNGFRFEDQTRALGIHFDHQNPNHFDEKFNSKMPYLYLGTGVAVADVDGNGRMDFIVLGGKKGDKNKLYMNTPEGRFIDHAKEWGIENTSDEGTNSSPVFFDYDNDGLPDLFITRMGCPYLFHNEGDRFKDVTLASGLKECSNSVTAIPFDYDGDGLLDLLVVRYWPPINYFNNLNSLVFMENLVDAKNGGQNSLYHNLGGGRFQDVTAEMGLVDTHWSFDAVIAQFFKTPENSRQLYVANDFGPDQFYSLNKKKHFDKITEKMGLPDRRLGMSASIGDLDGSGFPFLWISNDYRHEYNERGSFLLKFDEKGVRTDYAPAYQVHDCGWAWGSAFSDFDLDGKLDLYVANGFISGKLPQFRPGKRAIELKASDFAVETTMGQPGLIVKDAKNWMDLGDTSYEGHQTDCIYMNRGTQFQNVASQLGPNQEWDGRAVALIDILNKGTQDLIVTTQNGPVHILKNMTLPGKNWVGLQLIGTKSNRDAIGAKIKASQRDWKAYRWKTGRTGFMSTSDSRIHFGLPSEENLEVEIIWPSGIQQKLSNISPGKYYTITESGKISP